MSKQDFVYSESQASNRSIIKVETSKLSLQTIKNTLISFYKQNQSIIGSLILTVIVLIYFISFTFPSFFENIEYLKPKNIFTACFSLHLLISYTFTFFKITDIRKQITAWINLNLFTLVTFVYFLRLEGSNLNFNFINLNLSTSLVMVFFVILNFSLGYYILAEKAIDFWMQMSKVFISTLFFYSWISFLNLDNTQSREFLSDYLNNLFSLSPIFWLLIGAFVIAFQTSFSIEIKQLKTQIITWIFSTIIFYQILVLINIFSFSYWYKTLMFIVLWDFLVKPVSKVLLKTYDDKFTPKLIAHTVYHLILLAIVLITGLSSI